MPLQVAPEVFAYSAANPFRCPAPATGLPCDWRSDPAIARSAGEAAWMARRGYPTRADRDWADARTAAEVAEEAKRSGSAGLWALALERQVGEAMGPADARDAAMQLRRAGTGLRSLYAVEHAALAELRGIELRLQRAGAGRDGSSDVPDVHSAIRRARSDALQVALLGDPAAIDRVERALGRIPGLPADVRHGPMHAVSTVGLQTRLEMHFRDLKLNTRLRREGASLPFGGFTVDDVQPRPEIRWLEPETGSEGFWSED